MCTLEAGTSIGPEKVTVVVIHILNGVSSDGVAT